MARIVGEVLPAYVFVENVPMLVSRGLDVVLSDLAEMGYDAQWGVIGADAVGLPHHRARLWLVANSHEINGDTWGMLEKSGKWEPWWKFRRCLGTEISDDWRTAYQGVARISVFRDPTDGLATEVGELAALGNGQVPQVVALAWRMLNAVDRIDE